MKDNVDHLVERVKKEMESLACTKDKRQGLILLHTEIGNHLNTLRSNEEEVVRQGLTEDANKILFAHSKYAEYLNEGGIADLMYQNMRTYLSGVVEHLQVYKIEKEQMLIKLKSIEKNMKLMNSGTQSLIDSTKKPLDSTRDTIRDTIRQAAVRDGFLAVRDGIDALPLHEDKFRASRRRQVAR